ncbi:hypothetical protein EUTSA_v10024270mg [Eutrema salsugineum]|uniref:AIG1-type G domain-containing protein n=1 Tax=Eutrema salsugineum TaxID=72664 RepID=V4LYX3_EUTSA|nr:hypothetical protein EUTSA_v10024270mg [Eutrema salsugineum]
MEPRGISILAVDSEKPRAIAIPAARAVAADAFLLTHISNASNYSRGVDSGTDDGFESVSGDADDETELEDVIMGGVRVHRVLGDNPGGETGDGSDFSGGSVIYRPFAGDIEEETSLNYSSLEEESENNSEDVDGVSESEVSEADGVSMKAKVVIPRAILSLDDDEFDEILGSDDEGAALLRVTKAPGGEETEDRTSQFGGVGMADEPECSDSVIGEFVSTEEEVVMDNTDELDNGLKSFGNTDEQSLGVPTGGANDFIVEKEGNSTESAMGFGGNSKQLVEHEVQRSIINNDGGGSIHEVDTLMKPCDVEGVDDNAVESGKMGRVDKPECSGSVTSEIVSTDEDMVQVKISDNGLVSVETSLGVAPGDCNEFLVESEGNVVDADRGLDETFSKESGNRTDDNRSCEADESMIPGEGSIGIGRKESGDEVTGNMIGESKEHCENDCGAVSELEKSECKGEPEIGLSSETFQLSPTLNAVTTRNLEVDGGIDVVVSGCGSSDQKAEQEAENEGKQESEDINRKLSLADEDRAPSLRNSFETASESPEKRGQILEQINKQVFFQSDTEPNQISIEETSLLSVKDVERTMLENSCVTTYAEVENETQMARLVNNHTFMGKNTESNFQNCSEELSPDNSVQLISEKVKERVEKTKLLKEKLQRIIRTIDLGGENSAVTEVESKLSLADGEHQTSLGLDYVSDGTKIMLPEQEFPDDLDFSINVLVIGKTGVGKSATVNSIFGETKSPVGAFRVTTKSANYVVGNVGGVLIRVLDTPGLVSSATEEQYNQDVLMSIKKSIRAFPVDVFLFIDRLDDNPDIHLLRIVTSSLGSSIWRNAIVVLTHAASDVPDSSSCKDFIAQRSSLMHQSIRQAVPELAYVDQSKMPGIVLAENNNLSSLCGNKTSESTCVDWRLNLLILCCSVKIGSKADSLQKHKAIIEKAGVIGSQRRSFTVFCSLWNVLLLGANSGHASHSQDDLEEKKRRLLDSYPEILWDDQSQESLEPEDEETRHENGNVNKGLERGTVHGRVRTRRGRLGFQATKRFGIYLDTSDLHTGFSIGSRGCRKHEQEEEEERRILVRMRGSMSVLGLVPMFMSVFTCVYGRKDN